MLIDPSSGASNPAIKFSRVDLTQPEGPITAQNSPRATSSDTPLGVERPVDRHDIKHPGHGVGSPTTMPGPRQPKKGWPPCTDQHRHGGSAQRWNALRMLVAVAALPSSGDRPSISWVARSIE